MGNVLIYDEAGIWPVEDKKELSKKVKDALDRMNPSRKLFAKGEQAE